MKAAKLELKGLRCVEWAGVEGLHYPLFTVIQLHGYVLIAQCLVRLILTIPFPFASFILCTNTVLSPDILI
jgi:hypothetical protein